jgi:archaellum component FlaC
LVKRPTGPLGKKMEPPVIDMRDKPSAGPKIKDVTPSSVKTKQPKKFPKPTQLVPSGKPKGVPSGTKGKGKFVGMFSKLKGKGKLGLAAAALAAIAGSAYALWKSQKTDWDEYVDKAKESAEAHGDGKIVNQVQQADRLYNKVDDLFGESKGGDESVANSLNNSLALLGDSVDDLVSVADEVAGEMPRATDGMRRIIDELENAIANLFADQMGRAKGIGESPEEEKDRIAGIQKFFMQNNVRKIEPTGRWDRNTIGNLRLFRNNMANQFGPEFAALTSKYFNTSNLKDNATYDTLSDLWRVWKEPNVIWEMAQRGTPATTTPASDIEEEKGFLGNLFS